MAKIIKVPQKYFSTHEEFQFFVETERSWMYARIVEAIENAFHNKKNIAKIIKAHINENMSVVQIESKSDEWENSLHLALEWYEAKEEYEECSRIFNLITNIRTELSQSI